MAHSEHHLFAHLPHSRRAHSAIRAAEVPALHFHRYLGGCLVTVRGGKGCDKSNTKVAFVQECSFHPREGETLESSRCPHVLASE